jgi:hypothetical protein
MVSEWIKFGLKWGVLAFLGYVLIAHVRPVYWEAWQAKKAADAVAAKSDGKMKSEVRDNYLTGLQSAGVKSIHAENIDVSRNGNSWDVGAEYTIQRKLSEKLTLNFDFAVSSDRKSFWTGQNPSP